jgi:ankyrin repeat protein
MQGLKVTPSAEGLAWKIRATTLLGLLMGVTVVNPAKADPSACPDISRRYEMTKTIISSIELNGILFNASENGCDDLAKTLLKDGASLQARDREANTPLSRAARAGHASLVDLYAAKGGELDERNLKGSTPLFLAVENNRTAIVELLLKLGAKPDIPGRSSLTPLAAAAFNGNAKIADLLVSKGADVNAADSTGKTPILYAAARGFKPIVERLLAAGIDVNATYGNQLTVLMWAAGHANDVPDDDGIALVDYLVDHGAKLSAVDDRGHDALMIAAELGHAGIVRTLMAKGASPARTDPSGKTAADYAADDETRLALAGK